MNLKWQLADKTISLETPLVMGILNVTPDSFYDGGHNLERPFEHAKAMLSAGAGIIDVGGESTRPGATPVDLATELDRVIPVIEKIREFSDCLISIDSRNLEVARRALLAGADIINDVSGLSDPKMAELAGKSGAGYILMHSVGTPQTMQENPLKASEIMSALSIFFEDKIAVCQKLGLIKENLILDPGLGFGKTAPANQIIIKELSQLKKFDRPLLIGSSRKKFIGKIINQEVEQRLIGTITANIISVINGAKILRVHDVEETVEALKVIQAILGDD